MTKVLGGALNALKKQTETTKPVETPPAPPPPMDNTPIGVVVRFNPRDHDTVSQYASQHDMSIQELVETAINKMRAAEGLSLIEGRPRSKTRRRR